MALPFALPLKQQKPRCTRGTNWPIMREPARTLSSGMSPEMLSNASLTACTMSQAKRFNGIDLTFLHDMARCFCQAFRRNRFCSLEAGSLHSAPIRFLYLMGVILKAYARLPTRKLPTCYGLLFNRKPTDGRE